MLHEKCGRCGRYHTCGHPCHRGEDRCGGKHEGVSFLTPPVMISLSKSDPTMVMSKNFYPFSFTSVHTSGDVTNLPSHHLHPPTPLKQEGAVLQKVLPLPWPGVSPTPLPGPLASPPLWPWRHSPGRRRCRPPPLG